MVPYIENKPRMVRENNRKLILSHFMNAETLMVSDLQNTINLSKTTILKIIDELYKDNLILETGKGSSTKEGGRRPSNYSFNINYGYIIAFHIFPNELYSVLADLKTNILQCHSIPLSPDIALAGIIDLMSISVRILSEKQHIKTDKIWGIAVGSHGLTDYESGITITSPHFKNWSKNANIKKLLNQRFPSIKNILVDNQIRFQVLAEQRNGCARGMKNIIVLEAGVGLVAGIIVKDEIKRGAHYFAGEIGHMIIAPESDVSCECGAKGCFEAMVTTDRIISLAKRQQPLLNRTYDLQGKNDITMPDIFNAANRNDPTACKIVDEAAKWLAIGIINTILMYDPDIIVIQGIYSQGGNYLIKSLKNRIYKYAPVLENVDIKVELSTLGKDRGVIGGCSLLVERFFNTL